MASKVGDKSKSKFYVENVDDNFIVALRDFDIENESSRLVDRMQLKAGRNDNLEIGDELIVFDQSLPQGEQRIFGGYITSLKDNDETFDLEVDQFIVEAVDKKVKKVFEEKSPEAILEDLIENETSMSFSAPISSGFTLDKYVVEGKIENAIEDMKEILDWQIRTTPYREVFFEPRGRIEDDVTLERGKNAIITTFETKDSDYINTVELRAGRTNYARSESFTGDGSKTSFDLSELPTGAVDVTVDGNTQEGAIAEDLQSGDDFFIDSENGNLVFASAPANGANIEISYTYEVPVLVEAEAPNAPVPPSDREISTTIKRDWIKTFKDAREYASKYVKNHSKLLGSAQITIRSTDLPKVGHKARVLDPYKGIDQKLTVERKEISADGEVKLEMGRETFNSVEWRHSVQKRIQELERRNTTNKTLTKYLSFDNPLDVTLSYDLTVKKREVNDSFVLGSSSNGVLGEDKLGDRRGSKTTVLTTSG